MHGNWLSMYLNVINSFHELGYEIYKSDYIEIPDLPPFVNEGIPEDSSEFVYVYNHTTKQKTKNTNFHVGKKALFIKPTGPTPDYYTIDEEGYACTSSITYSKPTFEDIDSTEFFNTTVKDIIKNKNHKWSDRADLRFEDKSIIVPENHILVIGQMPGDETVTEMSFGDHWRKLEAIVQELTNQKLPVVIKLHPTLERESSKPNDEGITTWDYYYSKVLEWQSKGITVFYGFESLHDILPYSSVAIVENSTAGIDCMLHDVPLISYGYPEYHWVTFDLRHITQLQKAVDDLSWYSKERSRSWLTWYCTQYQCFNFTSTLNRIKDLL